MSTKLRQTVIITAFLCLSAILVWQSGPEKPASLAAESPSSSISRTNAAVLPRGVGKPAVSKDGLPLEISAGRLREQIRSASDADGSFRQVSVYETTFKYPLLRVEQRLQPTSTGQENVISQTVMVADHLLVRALPGLNAAQLSQRLAAITQGVRPLRQSSDLYIVKLRDASARGFDIAVGQLSKSKDVLAYAEPDYVVHHCAAPVIPNDPSFSQQWHLNNTGQTGGTANADVDAPEAWSVTTGSPLITVAVIDTGMDLTHPDLAANLWTNPGESGDGKETDGLDNDANGYIDDVHGWNFVAQTNSPNDDNGHGSHTGGLVGAVGGNAVGVSGVSQTVRLMPLKFLSASGSGANSDAIEAIEYATQKNVLLTSNSWGGSGFSQAMLDAIQNANAAGIGFVAAAGNSGVSNDLYPEYPTNFEVPNVIAVAATDHADTLTWFSNFGRNTVHLGAPGLQVYSTTMSGGYENNSGTSMAAPLVSGAAALLKAANPTLSFAQIKSMIIRQVDAKPSLQDKTISGGRLNVAKALVPATGPLLTSSALLIDDDSSHGAVGNADSIASPGETVNAVITVQNIGAFESAAVQGVLSLKTPTAGVTLLQTNASYGTLTADASAANAAAPFVIQISPGFAPADVALTLTLTDDQSRTWSLDVTLRVRTVAIISGTVTKVTGGVAFEGAQVTLVGPETHTVTTAADGTYSISVTNGTYAIQATATGYVPSSKITRTVPPAASSVDFALGYSAQNLTPTSLTQTLAEGATSTQTITIQNTGDQPLTYTIQEIPPPEPGASSLEVLHPLAPPSTPTPAYLSTAPARSLPAPRVQSFDASDNTATALPFRDGFEDGLWGRWFTGWGNGTREVVSNTAGTGSKSFHFHFDGPDDHFTGIHQIFPFGTQPGYVSFWTRPGAEDSATSYMVLLDLYLVFDNSGLHYEIADFIWFFANSNGRFYLNDNVGGNQAVQYTEGAWYHVEFRNVSWATKTFDYWVNGQLIQAGVPFRNPTLASGMAYALTYNYLSNTDMGLDDVKFQRDELGWINVSSKQGSVPPGGTATITATFDARAQLAGNYAGSLRVITNDPVTASSDIAVSLTVTPTPNATPVVASQSLTLGFGLSETITLSGSDADNDPLRYQITTLPASGTLYQTSDGITLGNAITNTPTVISDPLHRVIFKPATGGSGSPYASFQYIVTDPKISSATATIEIHVLDGPLLTISPGGSSSTTPLNVLLKCTDSLAEIRFTTNGSDPMSHGYSAFSAASLRVDHTLTLRAIAIRDGRTSALQEHTYIIADSDNNGLPDWWESQHSGLLLATTIDPNDDHDHDGLSNQEEFIFGSNPEQSDPPRQTHAINNSPPSLTWPSVLGRLYTIESSLDLDTWSIVDGPRLGTGGTMSYQSTTAVSAPRFYRMKVTLP